MSLMPYTGDFAADFAAAQEEKKRREAAAKAASAGLSSTTAVAKPTIGIGGKVAVSQKMTIGGKLAITPKVQSPTSVWNAPSQQIKKRVGDVKALMPEYTHTPSPLTQYHSLALRLGGQDKVAERLANIKALWDSHMAPYGGGKVLWQLTNSPLELPEIEAMLSKGGAALFGQGGNLEKAGMPASFAKGQGYDINDPEDLQKAVVAWQTQAGQKPNLFSRALSWAGGGTMDILSGAKKYLIDAPGEALNDITGGKAAAVEDLMAGGLGVKQARQEGQFSNSDWLAYKGRHKERKDQEGGRTPIVYAQEWNDPEAQKLMAQEESIAYETARAGTVFAASGYFGYGKAGLVKDTVSTLKGAAAGFAEQGGIAGNAAATVASASAQALNTGKFMAGMYGGMQVVGKVEEEWGSQVRNTNKVNELTEQALSDPLSIPDASTQLQTMITNAHGSSVTDGMEIQRQIQAGIKDEAGHTIVGSYGADLEVNGLWTPQWDQALRDYWADNRRYGVNIQRSLMEAGYAPLDLPVDGLLQGDDADPRWARVLDQAQQDLSAQYAFSSDHPVLSKFVQMTGMPMSRAGAEAFFRRIFNTGTMTGVLDLLTLEPVKAIGGTYNALMSTLTYETVENADSLYKELKTQWTQEVASGDPNADATKEKLLARQGQLLQNAFVPDPIMAASVGLGKDTQDAIKWSQDHPNWVLLASLGRDALLAGITPKIKQVATGQFRVKRTADAFMGSIRATGRINEMVKHIKNDKMLLAEETVGHAVDSPALVRDVDAIYKGKVGKRGLAFYNDLADRVMSAVDAGDVPVIERNTTLRGNAAEELADRVRTTHADPGLVGDAAAASRLDKVSKFLAKEQKGNPGFLDLERVAKDWAARKYWADGASIFPDFQSPGQVKKSYKFNRQLISAIDNVSNDSVREFLSAGLSRVEKKPLRQLDVAGIYNSDRVFYNALAATGDVTKALEFESRWMRTTNPNARIQIAKEVGESFNRRYKAKPRKDPTTPELGVDPLTGELIQEGTAAMPTYLKYTADFGSVNQFNLPLNILDNWGIARKTVTKYLANPGRRLSSAANVPSNFLRRWTVALGPMLFVKHSVADSSRTIIEIGPRALVNHVGERAGMEKRISNATPETANMIRYRRERMKASVEHYYVGNVGIKVDWDGTAIYQETKPGKFEPVNMDRGVDALRRIAGDPVYRAYVEGGREGVRTYLNTGKGRQFMTRSRLYRDFKENGGELIAETQGVKVYDLAVQEYLDTQVRTLFEGMEDVAPNIAAGLKKMSLNELPADAKTIRKLVEDVNKDGMTENPFLSMPDDMGHPLSSRMTGKLMTMNKANRVATFNRTFNKAYDSMIKDGAAPDIAAKVAADIADLTTTRIHFDLSNALAVEAQFRWVAWFATKHRLYNTYLTRMAVERPSIAGAVSTFQNWLGQRNEDKNLPEWDKHTVALPLDFLHLPFLSKGSEIRMNLGTLFWIGDQMQESSLMQLAESAGAKPLSYIPGSSWVMPPTMSDFGLSTGRWDQTLFSIGAAIPVLDAWLGGDLNDQWTAEYLNGEHWGWMAGKATNSIKKSMDIQMALAMHEGTELSPSQALGKAVIHGFAYQAVQMGKVWPGRIVFGDAEKYDSIMREFNQKTPEERRQMIDESPDIRFMFGIYSTNPAEQYSIVRGFTSVANVYKQRAVALNNALDNGKIYDKNEVASIFTYYDDLVDQITDPEWRTTIPDYDGDASSPLYNETFAAFWNHSGMQQMSKEQMLQGLFPLCDPRAISRDGYIPSDNQMKMFSESLNGAFNDECKARNLPFTTTKEGSYPNGNDPAVFWLKQDMVVKPLREYMKGQNGDGWTTSFENSVARDLAKGPGGPTAATKFLAQIHHNDELAMYAKGTDGMAKDGYSGLPMFATMTALDKEQIGWNSNISTENSWKAYSTFVSNLSAYMAENGISTSSKAAKDMRAKIADWAEQESKNNALFGLEYHFGQQSLGARLSQLGVGGGNTKADEGWANFLSLDASYRADLANTYNKSTKKMGVGPTAQAAFPVFTKYVPELIDLKKKYPEWWDNLTHTFGGLSKFGFIRWRLPGDQDNELWQGQDISIYDPFSEGGE
jgi:hypothetical protein